VFCLIFFLLNLRSIAKTDTGCFFGSSVAHEPKKMDNPKSYSHEITKTLIQDLKEKGCMDSYLQDQLIIYMALANGKSKIKTGPLTLHTTTAIHFCEKISGAKFQIVEEKEGSFVIQCDGIGYKNKNF
jgi:RNA 3'-terminal phosphate cyclase (ATP)